MSNFNFNPSSGWGDSVIEVSPKNTNYNVTDRKSTAYITDGVSTKPLSVIQYGVPHAENMSGDGVYPSSGGSKAFRITTHYPIYFDNIPSWIEILDEEDGGIEEGVYYYPIDVSGRTLYFIAEENAVLSGRTGTVTMHHELRNSVASEQQALNFQQDAAEPYYSVGKNVVIFQGEDDSSSTDTVPVQTNLSVSLDEVGGNFTAVYQNGVITISPVGQNTGTTKYNDVLYVYFYNGDTLYATVTITIEQNYVNAPYIRVEPSILYFGSFESGVTKTVTVYTNRDWSSMSSSYVRFSPQRGTSSETGTVVEVTSLRNNLTANDIVTNSNFSVENASASLSAVLVSTVFETTIDNPQEYYMLYPYNNSANTLYGTYEAGPSLNMTATMPWEMRNKRSDSYVLQPDKGSSGTTQLNTKAIFDSWYSTVASNKYWNAWDIFTPVVSGATSRKGSPINVVNVLPPIFRNAAWTAKTACPTWFIPASGGSISVVTYTDMVDHQFMFHDYDYRSLKAAELAEIIAYDGSGNTMAPNAYIPKKTYNTFYDVVSGMTSGMTTFEFGDIGNDYKSYLIEQKHVFPNGSSGYSQTLYPASTNNNEKIHNKLQIIQGGIPVQYDETFFGTETMYPYAGAFIPFNEQVVISATSSDYQMLELEEYNGFVFRNGKWVVDATWSTIQTGNTINGVYHWSKYYPSWSDPDWDKGLDLWPIVGIGFNTDRIMYPQSAITKQLYYSMPVYGIGSRPLSPTTMKGLLYERTLVPWPQVSIDGDSAFTQYDRAYVFEDEGVSFEVTVSFVSDYPIRYWVSSARSHTTIINNGTSYAPNTEVELTGASETFILRCSLGADETDGVTFNLSPNNAKSPDMHTYSVTFSHKAFVTVPITDRIVFREPKY